LLAALSFSSSVRFSGPRPVHSASGADLCLFLLLQQVLDVFIAPSAVALEHRIKRVFRIIYVFL
jgi:hypothetical protein